MASRPVEEVTRRHDGQEDTQSFAPLPLDVSLDELLPKDHFYRLEARLNLSFVRELVASLYANGGRCSSSTSVRSAS